MKSKKTQNRFVDLILFFGVAVVVIYIVAATTKTFNDPITLVLLFLFIIPTIIALVHGAPFVPTPIVRVQKMLALAKIKPGDKVYDIGCGDGRIVYLAAKEYGAKAVGFELSPVVYMLARIRKILWRSKAKIYFRDSRRKNLSDANVIFCYLMPDTLAKLQSKFEQELKPGTRIVSYAFPIGTLTPSHVEPKDPAANHATIYVYTI